jgi:FHA domain-containing protein
MSVSMLNSVFLGSDPRRQDFRRAKEKLYDARGELTCMADDGMPALQPLEPGAIQELPPKKTLGLDAGFVLTDGIEVFPLKVGTNTVGRFTENDIVFPDKHISRRHCVILIHTNHHCELHDTASLNGLLLNDQRMKEPTPLVSGDRIRVGKRELVFLSSKDAHFRDNSSLEGETIMD